MAVTTTTTGSPTVACVTPFTLITGPLVGLSGASAGGSPEVSRVVMGDEAPASGRIVICVVALVDSEVAAFTAVKTTSYSPSSPGSVGQTSVPVTLVPTDPIVICVVAVVVWPFVAKNEIV